MVNATERKAYGWIDTRAVFGDGRPGWWHVVWMAVSCCCGIEGRHRTVDHLPPPDPRPPGY
jgi:hypothetical protein